MLNEVRLIGRLTQAPELHYTSSGRPVSTLRLATNSRSGGTTYTEYHDIEAWQQLAETVSKAVTKGEIVHVEGALRTESWESDGQKQRRTKVIAQRITFLGTGHKSAAGHEAVAVADDDDGASAIG